MNEHLFWTTESQVCISNLLPNPSKNYSQIIFHSLPNDKMDQIEGTCRRQIKIKLRQQFLFMIGSKTFWEKEKMLGSSIFSFSKNVSKRSLLDKGRDNTVWQRAKLKEDTYVYISHLSVRSLFYRCRHSPCQGVDSFLFSYHSLQAFQCQTWSGLPCGHRSAFSCSLFLQLWFQSGVKTSRRIRESSLTSSL